MAAHAVAIEIELDVDIDDDETLALPARSRPPGPPPKPKSRPKASALPQLTAPATADFGSLDLKVPAPPIPSPASPFAVALPTPSSPFTIASPTSPLSPLTAAAMLDFTRDVSTMTLPPSSNFATGLVKRIRPYTRWLAMAGGTLLIATASWAAFRVASTAPSAEDAAKGRATPVPANTVASTASPTTSPSPVASAPAAVDIAAAANTKENAPPSAPEDTETAPQADPKTEVAALAPAEATTAIAPGSAAKPDNERVEKTSAPAEKAPIEKAPAPSAAEPAARTASAETARPRASAPAERSAPSRQVETAAETPAVKAPPPAPAPAPAAPPPSPDGFDATPNFDQSAAMQALRQAADGAARCRTAETPSGGVRVAVTFARTGQVTSADVEGPAAATPLGECVASKFRTLRVPAFRGSVMTVRKTVMF